jgi:hypothetical protein
MWTSKPEQIVVIPWQRITRNPRVINKDWRENGHVLHVLRIENLGQNMARFYLEIDGFRMQPKEIESRCTFDWSGELKFGNGHKLRAWCGNSKMSVVGMGVMA